MQSSYYRQKARENLDIYIASLGRTAFEVSLMADFTPDNSPIEERYTWFVNMDQPLPQFESSDTRYVLKSRRPFYEREVEGAIAFTALSEPGQGYRVIGDEKFFVMEYIDGISAYLFNDSLISFLSNRHGVEEDRFISFMRLHGEAGAKHLLLCNCEYGKDEILGLDGQEQSHIVSVDLTSSLPDPSWNWYWQLKNMKNKFDILSRTSRKNGISSDLFQQAMGEYFDSLIGKYHQFQQEHADNPERLEHLFDEGNHPFTRHGDPQGWQETLKRLSLDVDIEKILKEHELILTI